MKPFPLLILTIFIFFLGCAESSDEIEVRIKPLTEAVYASGYVRAAAEVKVTARTEGELSAQWVQEGDTVSKDQKMFQLDYSPAAARNDAARLTYTISKENLSAQSAALKEAAALLTNTLNKLRFDSLQFSRYQNLYKQDALSRVELDRARLAYDNTRNEYALQQSRYTQLENKLKIELAQAKAGNVLAEEDFQQYTIQSPLPGRVLKILKEVGETVRRGEEVALIAASNGFILRLNIDEEDIHRMQPGQHIKVQLDARPGETFDATLTRIYPVINTREQSVQVDAVFDNPPNNLISGMAAEANIIIQQKENAQVIPVNTLIGKDSVWVMRKGTQQKVHIQTGLQTLEETEVISGLEPGDKILKVQE